MKIAKKMLVLGAMVANMAMVGQVSAELKNSIEFGGGWRRDDIKISNSAYNFNGGTLTDQEINDARNIDLGVFTIRGITVLPECLNQPIDPCCNSFFNLNNLYARWSLAWGWGGDGKFKETDRQFVDGVQIFEVIDNGKAQRARSADYDIALGYLIPVGCDFGIAPVVGFNYDRTAYSIRKLVSEFELFDASQLNGTRITSKWESPYLGVDLGYKFCDIGIAAGYEYHWITKYRGTLRVGGRYWDTVDGFTAENRYGDKGWGHVVRLDLNYNLCGWDLGLNFKYRLFRLTGGIDTQPMAGSDAVRLPFDEVNYDSHAAMKARQRSYEINVFVGRSF